MNAPLFVGRIGKRARAAELQERMLRYSTIYNAACLLRHAWLGSDARRAECAKALADVLTMELKQAKDVEALLYSVADALYCSPHGVPWES
jgi:hypothetical protein